MRSRPLPSVHGCCRTTVFSNSLFDFWPTTEAVDIVRSAGREFCLRWDLRRNGGSREMFMLLIRASIGLS